MDGEAVPKEKIFGKSRSSFKEAELTHIYFTHRWKSEFHIHIHIHITSLFHTEILSVNERPYILSSLA